MKTFAAVFLALFVSTPLFALCRTDFSHLSEIEAALVTPLHRLHNPVKEALAEGSVVYGNVQNGHDLPTAKSLAAGGHFLWLREGERPGEFTPSEMEPIVSATHGLKPAVAIVELESWNSPSIKPILGLGVLGIAAPGIENEEQARTFLGSVKFPSAGFLGLGPDDTTAFLADADAASKFGNQARMAIVVLDRPSAAASEGSLRAILGAQLVDKNGKREGFDAVLPDRNKLSPQEVARVEKIARELGLPLVGDVTNREEALVAARQGYRLFRYGSDIGHVRAASQNYLASGAANPRIEATPRKPTNADDNPLYEAVHGDKLAVGLYSMGHDPLLAVHGTQAGSGKVFVWADGEHRPLDAKKLRELMDAIHAQTPAVVIARVPHQRGADPAKEMRTIESYVQLGVRGLVQPNVSTPEEAQAFIEHVEGAAAKSGKPLTAVMKSVMIETKEGLENIDRILDVVERHKDTMWVHVGPFDLLNSLKAVYGEQLSFTSPEFKAAILTIETKCRARGIALGGLALSRKQAQEKYALGYRVLTVGSDQEGINAGIDQFLASSPNDPSRVQRERLVATVLAAKDLPWTTIRDGRLKKINDPANHTTLNYVEVSGALPAEAFGHAHMQQQTTYVVEGKYRVKVGDKEYELKAGDAITLPAGIWHEFTRLSEKAVLLDVLSPGRVGAVPKEEVGARVSPDVAKQTLGKFFGNYGLIPSGFDVFRGSQAPLLAPEMVTEVEAFGTKQTYQGPDGYFQSLGDWSAHFHTGDDFRDLQLPSAPNADGTYSVHMPGTLYVTNNGRQWAIPPSENHWTETFLFDREGRIRKLVVSMGLPAATQPNP